jgi:excisionase family DNA binding protein
MNPKMPLRGSSGKPASRNSLAHCLRAMRESGAARVASALRKKCRQVVGVKVMSSRIEVANKARDTGLNRPKFLDVKELAEMRRLKTRTIYDMVSEGRIPYRKAGDRTIFLLDEILDWTKPDRERQ